MNAPRPVSTERGRVDAGKWPAGWYLVGGAGFVPGSRVRLAIQTPAVPGQHARLPLASVDARGRLESVVVLTHDTDRLWVESEAAAELPLPKGLELRRIGRAGAVWRMLTGMRARDGGIDWKAATRTLLDALAMASGTGISRAAGLIVSRYLSRLRGDPVDDGVYANATLRPGPLPLTIPVQLQPLGQVEPDTDAVGDPGAWRATGGDPGFQLADHGAMMALEAGWYRLQARIRVEAGAVASPVLYPDYGQGYVHGEMIHLPEPGRDGRIDALILLRQDVRGLRFDPVSGQTRFGIARFHLARVGRISALLRMFADLRRANGERVGPRELMAAIAGFARTAAAHDVSTAASDLYAMQPCMRIRGGSYADWVRRYDTIGRTELERFRQRARAIHDGPLISVIVPCYQTPERWLRRCLDSVLRQVYPNWELCIADDASPDPRVREVLEEYAARDARIKLALRTVNGHIAEASNSALELAAGTFIGLLDHDDELRPHALLEMAEVIVRNEDLGLLYSDEDKLDAEGARFDPYFKPDWNPDLLLSQNYVCHFTVIRAELARRVGGFRKGFEGSQDHDLFLRCTELLAPGQIHHVPKVLYHWRAIEGSTALAREAKDYAAEAGARAVAGHLERRHRGARVEALSHGHYRVHWPLPEPPPKVSLVIPTRDKVDLLRTCVGSILERTRYPAYEVVVVDNQSSDPAALEYLARIERDPRVHVLRYDAPFNYSAINNWAVGQCDGAVIGLLNNDIEVISRDWLDEMVSQALRAGIGAVGAMLYYPNDTIQHAGVVLGVHGVAAHRYAGMPKGYPGHGGRALVAQQLSAVTGACLMVARQVYAKVGGLDEALQVAFNDIDFCLRLEEAGYRNAWTPFAELYHHESASRGSENTEEKQLRFASEVDRMVERWGSRLGNDPAYNPNLSLQSLNSELATPPRVMH